MMNNQNVIIAMKKFAPVVLRLGLVFVFVWFGTSQWMNQMMWVGLIPKWVVTISGISAVTLVKINGTFELVMAVLLAFGVQVRIVAFLLFLHLVSIVSDVGLSSIGIRDTGLMMAALSVALHGADAYSYDKETI